MKMVLILMFFDELQADILAIERQMCEATKSERASAPDGDKRL